MKKIFSLKTLIVLAIIGISQFECLAQDSYKQAFKFAKFLDYLNTSYVDSVNSEKIVEDAIISILKDLDPHSTYIPADQLKKMREPLEGNFEGIGISFSILNDTLFVISAIAGGPSDMVGILAGDKILKVDGKNIAGTGLTNEDVFSLLRGKKGTKVNVTILRKGSKNELDFLIVRDKIPIYSLDASYMINENTGYIKLNRFSATTVEEFTQAAQQLKSQKATNLILDLTANGGGYLDAAVKLADEFLAANQRVVYTEGIHSPRQEFLTTQFGNFETGKVIVLIDEGSASASEILAGAIQDWDRGLIIGRRSFGKGLVQREMLLPDESAVRITVAQYFTPSGRLIQKPYENGVDDYHLEVYQRFSKGELGSADSIHFPDSLKYKTLIKGRTVYGGGGIMPDIFVPFDTSYYSNFFRDLIRLGIINSFVLEYVDNNRERLLNEFSEFESFNKTFEVDEKLFEKLLAYSEKNSLQPSQVDLDVSGNYIKLLVKAFLARDLYGQSEFYQIYNTTNQTYNKAIEVLENWNEVELNVLH